MSGVAEASSSNRRDFFRVQSSLPIRHRVLDARSADAARAKLDAAPPTAVTPMERILERLAAVEGKLDRILAQLDVNVDAPLSIEDARMLSISASGLSYTWPEAVEAGAVLLVEFEIPEIPPRQIFCMAEVVHCIPDEESDELRIALRYTRIRQDDQDAIVRYALRVEREAKQEERQVEESE